MDWLKAHDSSACLCTLWSVTSVTLAGCVIVCGWAMPHLVDYFVVCGLHREELEQDTLPSECSVWLIIDFTMSSASLSWYIAAKVEAVVQILVLGQCCQLSQWQPTLHCSEASLYSSPGSLKSTATDCSVLQYKYHTHSTAHLLNYVLVTTLPLYATVDDCYATKRIITPCIY